MEREILRHPDFGEIEVVVENGEWWFFGRDIARIKTERGDNPSLSGNDLKHVKKFGKKFPRVGKRGNDIDGFYINLDGIRELTRHGNGRGRGRIVELLRWLSEIIKEGELQTLFSKLQFSEKEPCTKPATPNIYDCIETTRNDLTGKIGELQGIFDIMLAKWKTCVDTGLRYKSERDNVKTDPQKMESLEFRLARLKVILGRHDLRAKRSAYDQLGQNFPINGKSPLHEPQEIAKYFGITSQELNDWLMKNGLQEKVENPSWGDAKYRPLPTPLGSQLAEVVYREEEKGQKFYHLQWNELGLAYIIGAWICEHEYIND